jgi:uncharacterized delta-60 repeat protein
MKSFLFLSLCVGIMLCSGSSYGTPGKLDPSFGNGGIAIAEYSQDYAYGMDGLIQNTGKIVIVGGIHTGTGEQLALTRLNADGSTDSTFGTAGWVVGAFGQQRLNAWAVAQQADGKIIVGGNMRDLMDDENFAVLRFSKDGVIDTTFGSNGVAVYDFGVAEDELYDIAIQSDDRIVAVGAVDSATDDLNIGVVRLQADGSVDTAFGNQGQISTDFFHQLDYAAAVAIQPDGKIVVAGSAFRTATDGAFAAVRYDTAGALDPTFSSNGKVFSNTGPIYDFATSVEIQSDGKILLAGVRQNNNGGVFQHIRFNTNGTVDKKWKTNFAGVWEAAYSVALTAAGKIVTGGRSDNGGDSRMSLSCHLSDGARDMSFGKSGKVKTDIDTGSDGISTIRIQADNKIVAIGTTHDAAGRGRFIVARYLGCD